jgi:Na+/glutamate symporter
MKNVLPKIVLGIGGVYYLLLALLAFLYLNWPFGSPEMRYHWPLYGMLFATAGYVLSFWRQTPGGWTLIFAAILITIAQLYNPRDLSLSQRLISIAFMALPSVAFGMYFIRRSKMQATDSKNQ